MVINSIYPITKHTPERFQENNILVKTEFMDKKRQDVLQEKVIFFLAICDL